MRVLVTGSKGQLGSSLKRLAVNSANHSFFFYAQEELDITDSKKLKKLLQLHEIDVLVNCAAYTLVDQAESNSALCYAINQRAVKGIGEIANELGVEVIHFSTDYVFDGTSYVPYVEDDEVNPQTVYGDSKWKGEQDLFSVCPQSMIIRTAWLYADVGINFVQTIIKLGKEKKQLKVVFDQIGTPTSAIDLAQFVLHILDKGLVPGIYHYSNEGVCSWYDFAKAILSLCGMSDCKVLPIHSSEYPTKAKRPYYSVLDKTKVKQVYKIQIPHWYDSLCGVIKKSL
ncbi:MAG: dTDP-4-dehydrorhamnose reductase [Bacteroidales bacterium]|nr:dTDP-4-dehydrorhamnose reductase [Bacteroidales bacterium]